MADLGMRLNLVLREVRDSRVQNKMHQLRDMLVRFDKEAIIISRAFKDFNKAIDYASASGQNAIGRMEAIITCKEPLYARDIPLLINSSSGDVKDLTSVLESALARAMDAYTHIRDILKDGQLIRLHLETLPYSINASWTTLMNTSAGCRTWFTVEAAETIRRVILEHIGLIPGSLADITWELRKQVLIIQKSLKDVSGRMVGASAFSMVDQAIMQEFLLFHRQLTSSIDYAKATFLLRTHMKVLSLRLPGMCPIHPDCTDGIFKTHGDDNIDSMSVWASTKVGGIAYDIVIRDPPQLLMIRAPSWDI